MLQIYLWISAVTDNRNNIRLVRNMWKRELDSCLGAKAISAERSCRKVTGPPTTLVSPPTLDLVHDQFMTESQSLKDGIQLWLSQMHSLHLSQFLRNSWLIIICAQARRPRRSYGLRCVYYQLKPRYEGLSVNLRNAFSYDSFCDEIVSITALCWLVQWTIPNTSREYHYKGSCGARRLESPHCQVEFLCLDNRAKYGSIASCLYTDSSWY